MTIEMQKNTSGLRPAGHRVVVLPIEKERKTESGIILTDPYADREDMAQVQAWIIAIGPSAWGDQKGGSWARVGDKVLIAKFSGLYHTGPDDRKYRVINDLDVVAVVTDE